MWVMKLAEKLMGNGIEAMLDMWELGPGDDIARFMERGLKEADRILMICTAQYVAKAEAGKGGVGYEKMIMTAEYMKQVDSKRVIPVIRQSGTNHVPTFLGTKLYMDFSTEDRAEYNFDQLARELHGKPLYEKPRLGAVPNFEITPLAEPKLAEDPLVKVMRVVAAVHEANSNAVMWMTSLIPEAKAQGMSRTYFESILGRATEALFIEKGPGARYYTMTDRGRAFVLERQLA